MLGIKVLCAPGPAVQGRKKRAPPITGPAPALTLTTPCPVLDALLSALLFFKARGGIRNYGTEKTKLGNWEALNGLNDQKRELAEVGDRWRGLANVAVRVGFWT